MNGYYQLIEGHDGGFMFSLRAGNHETILESRVYWSRQATLDAIETLRHASQNLNNFIRHETVNACHFFEEGSSTIDQRTGLNADDQDFFIQSDVCKNEYPLGRVSYHANPIWLVSQTYGRFGNPVEPLYDFVGRNAIGLQFARHTG